jgi:hypothetical protein
LHLADKSGRLGNIDIGFLEVGGCVMSTYDARLAALEKDVAVMKQDIIYKLDETNSAITVIQGVVGVQGRDIKYLITQVKGLDIRLEGLTLEVRAIQEQQHVQGQDITDIKRRLDGIDQRFVSLEEKFDRRFEQVLQAIATLTKKAE